MKQDANRQERYRNSTVARRRLPGKFSPVWLLWILPLLLRILWIRYSNFIEEDAYIIFRYARNISCGAGYVFNPGERAYGSTTPLFTLFLAAANLIFRDQFVFTSRLFGLIFSLGFFLLTVAALRRLSVGVPATLAVLGLFALSSKSILMDTQGMETPLVCILMAASWFCFVAERPGWAGVFAGLMLWTRVDTVLWPAALAITACLTDFRQGLRLLLAAGLVYLPWAAFAGWYFGSPVPLTLIAKWVAGGVYRITLPEHLLYLVGFLSPVDFGPFSFPAGNFFPTLLFGWLAFLIAAWFSLHSVRQKGFFALFLFSVFEFVRLADVRSGIDNRFFYPFLVCVWILFLLGAASLVRLVQQQIVFTRRIAGWASALLAAPVLISGASAAARARSYQVFRNEQGTQEVGLWLKAHTPEDALILLEPLGYIGFFSERRMVDEVGLVTPRAVALRMQGVPIDQFFRYFQPDYIVQHCGYEYTLKNTLDGGKAFLTQYDLLVEINPLGYDPQRKENGGLSWISCYAVWRRMPSPANGSTEERAE
jgi:hypothetical protein